MLAELLASSGVEERFRVGSAIGVMALHGGIEAGTAEMAELVARSVGASYYAVIQPDDLRWHVPSTAYVREESPALDEFLGHVSTVISFHGFGRRGLERSVLVGGTNRSLANLIAAELCTRSDLDVISDLQTIPRGLRGLHHNNPVNVPTDGGVQLELGPDAREGTERDSIVAAVASVIAGW